jgi:hypothetical protein
MRQAILRRKWVWGGLLALLAIAATLGSLTLTGVFSSSSKSSRPGISARVVRVVDRIRRLSGQPPFYYLDLHYDGLHLVDAEAPDPMDPSSSTTFGYADCTMRQLGTFDPACHRTLVIDLSRPERGEITIQGRCTYSTTVRGATAALFPVNPGSLRIFTKGTTIYVSSRSLRESLAAARCVALT